jgi:hypothetical protein
MRIVPQHCTWSSGRAAFLRTTAKGVWHYLKSCEVHGALDEPGGPDMKIV